MKFYRVAALLVFCFSAAMAAPINAPPSITPGNLYSADSTPTQADDSGIAAASVSTIGLTSHGDSNYALASADRVIQVSAALTAPRTWTLACAASVPAGQMVQIIDPTMKLSPNNFVKLVPASSGCSDTLNGSSLNAPQVGGAGSRAVAVSDGASNWSVTVIRQPVRTLDFASDFGGVQATAIGTTDCAVVGGSTTVTCSHTNITSADQLDQFEVQAGNSDGTTFTTMVQSVNTVAHQLILSTAPHFGNSTKVIDTLFVCNPSDVASCTSSSGYSFGSTQALPTGATGDVPVTGATPALMTVVGVRVHSGGTGGLNGPVTVVLNPSGNPNALSGVQATFSATISGHTLTSPSVASGALYRAIGSYTYSSGWYLNIPITGGALSGATVDIEFGVVVEVISNNPNVYAAGFIPCNNDNVSPLPTPTTSSDAGTNLMVTCGTHKPLVSFGHDNLLAIEAVNDYESAQIAAHEPACVKFSGRFLSSAIDLAARPQHLITGGPCLEGDAQILSGIFIFPAASKSGDMVIFPIVNANGNGSTGPVQAEIITDDPNGKGVMAGTYITNLAFWGDWSSQVVQNAIKFYGLTQWATVMNVSSWNVRGCLICVGVDTEDNPNGQIYESVFFNLRTEFTGDKSSATPAFGLDGVGAGANSPNNDVIIRYRTYQDNGVPLTIRPCTSPKNGDNTGYGAHELTVSELKVEESSMELSPNATDGVQVGATVDECKSLVWGVSDGTYFDEHLFDPPPETGVHGLTFVAPNVVNSGVNTAAFHFKGCTSADLQNMRILGGLVSSSDHGMGVKFDVGQSGNVVDLVKNNTSDYNLIYSGTFANTDCPSFGNVVSSALEYDAHDNTTVALIDPGINVMTVLRCALGFALTACDGANGQLVDQNSAQTISNKTIKMSSLLMSTLAPTISSGFGTSPSIVAANGSAAFQINVGTGGTASSGTVVLPTAAHGWDCKATDITTQSTSVFLTKQTGSTLSTAAFTNYTTAGVAGPWAASDKLNVTCQGF